MTSFSERPTGWRAFAAAMSWRPGGAIRHAEWFLAPDGDSGSFLVHNVDIISDLDIGWFMSHARDGALATLLVSERRTDRYLLFDSDMRLAGWTNVSTGEVRSPYPDLDVSSCCPMAFSGIHIVSGGIFPIFGSEGFGERFPIMDFYLKVADRYPVYGLQASDLRLIDVGKAGSLAEAEKFLTIQRSRTI